MRVMTSDISVGYDIWSLITLINASFFGTSSYQDVVHNELWLITHHARERLFVDTASPLDYRSRIDIKSSSSITAYINMKD